jgi:hypothetical protein
VEGAAVCQPVHAEAVDCHTAVGEGCRSHSHHRCLWRAGEVLARDDYNLVHHHVADLEDPVGVGYYHRRSRHGCT